MQKELPQDICQEHVFARIYDEYSRDLYRYLYYRYGEQINPEDKTQEAFVKLWEHCAKVTLKTAKSFLFKVAKNLTLNEIKHNKVVLRYQKSSHMQPSHESPQFLMEEQEFARMFQKALSDLSEEQRVAFMLNKVEGKKHQEIAEMLGVSR